jgi:hypothetical protein
MVPELNVDFATYDWLFTVAKANRVGGIDAGQSWYQKAADNYRRECELRDIPLASCSNLISNQARYLAVSPQGVGMHFPRNDILGPKSTLTVVAQWKTSVTENSVPKYQFQGSVLPSVTQTHK